jgi:hypothetical protein
MVQKRHSFHGTRMLITAFKKGPPLNFHGAAKPSPHSDIISFNIHFNVLV